MKAKFFLIVLILFVLAFGGYLVWRSGGTDEVVPMATPTDDKAGWQTYRNDEYGFELAYPPALYRIGAWNECGENCIGFSPAGSSQYDWVVAMWVYPTTSYADVKSGILNEFAASGEVLATEQEVIANSVTWTQLTLTQAGASSRVVARRYFTEYAGTVYEMSNFGEMLPVFAFTAQP